MSGFINSGTVRRSDAVRIFALVFVDIFALYEAFLLAYVQRAAQAKPLAHHISVSSFSLHVVAIAPMWVVFFAICGLYSGKFGERRASELPRILVGVAGGVTSLIVWDYLSPSSPLFPSRSIPIWAIVYGVVLVSLFRFLVARMARSCLRRGLGLHHVILIGGGPLAGRIAQEMAQPDLGYRIVANVHPSRLDGTLDSCLLGGDIPVFDTLAAAMTASGRVDEIMQADSGLSRTDSAAMMAYAAERGISYRFVPDQYGLYAAASSASSVGGVPVLELRLTAQDGWDAIGKRAFDLLGALALLLLLSPVLLIVALLVKLGDPKGPVLYRQSRLGKYGAKIRVCKFRSMSWTYSTGPDRPYQSADEAFLAMGRADLCAEFARHQKVLADPRVSAVGRFLRRTSLDELPQLLNVVLGELSLVGPRPITAGELARYGDQRASFLTLKPGITGLWQVSGRSDISYEDRVRLDVFYVEHWSVGLDLRILFRTLRIVTARGGAY